MLFETIKDTAIAALIFGILLCALSACDKNNCEDSPILGTWYRNSIGDSVQFNQTCGAIILTCREYRYETDEKNETVKITKGDYLNCPNQNLGSWHFEISKDKTELQIFGETFRKATE